MNSLPESAGTVLKNTREAKGVSLEEISNRSNISMRYLAAIEECRYDDLPDPVFTRAFLRQYAQFIGLEGEEVVELYRLEREGVTEEPGPPAGGVKWILPATLAVAVAVLGFYVSQRSPKRQTPPAPTLEAQPNPPPSGIPAAAVSSLDIQPTTLEIRFTRRCWISLSLDGKDVYEGIREPGDTLTYAVRENLKLRAGNGGALTILKNGRPYAFARVEGQPVDLVIDNRERAES